VVVSRTLLPLGASVVLPTAFVMVEDRVRALLRDLGLLRQPALRGGRQSVEEPLAAGTRR
jgi:hypothetical protein